MAPPRKRRAPSRGKDGFLRWAGSPSRLEPGLCFGLVRNKGAFLTQPAAEKGPAFPEEGKGQLVRAGEIQPNCPLLVPASKALAEGRVGRGFLSFFAAFPPTAGSRPPLAWALGGFFFLFQFFFSQLFRKPLLLPPRPWEVPKGQNLPNPSKFFSPPPWGGGRFPPPEKGCLPPFGKSPFPRRVFLLGAPPRPPPRMGLFGSVQERESPGRVRIQRPRGPCKMAE